MEQDKSISKFGEKVFSISSQTERLLFVVVLALFVISGLSLAWKINNSFLTSVPDYGGTLKEGVIGIPRFINPVLAGSDADKDLTSLVYSGLLKVTPEGRIIPDLAKEFTISSDARTYSFVLKDDIKFHDGTPITTDDIEFTIQKIQDPTIKSPKRPFWDGVVIRKTSPTEINFTLRQARANFIEDLTVGILPKNIWRNIPSAEFSFSQFNVTPIGSGPYKVSNIKRNSIGLPIYYELTAFKDHALGRPFIGSIITRFYQSEREILDAYKNSEIESLNGLSPKSAKEIKKDSSNIAVSTLPRIFGVFFNQNQAPVFVNKEVRQALAIAVDKDNIVEEVLGGYGKTIDGPLLPKADAAQTSSGENPASTSTSSPSKIDEAISILSKNGWTLNSDTGVMEKKTKTETIALRFSLVTGDATELKQAAEKVKESWEKIGASVDLKVFEIGDLNQNIIRPRKYDALFFGEVVGGKADLYSFWHSSQRNDPGLNIALYTNIRTDKLLEEMRETTDEKIQQEKLSQFETIIKEDVPAVFVYAPEFIYIVPVKIKNIELGYITNSGDRFLNVHQWYINTNKVWKIFTN